MKIKDKIKSDNGFMGPTHAMSAIAFYLLLFLFWKSLLIKLGLSDNVVTLFMTSIVIAGAALLPDLDNVTSTALSVLGPLGKVLSGLMRTTSTTIFYLTRTKYDEKKADPHRGFWHTLLSAFLLGLLIQLSLKLDITINTPLSKFGFSGINDYFAFLWVFITVQLAMSGLVNSTVKKYSKNVIGKLTLSLVGTVVSLFLIYSNDSSNNYNWLSVCIVLGYIFHILGDTMTVAGTPLLFPLKFKGKRWFNHRIMKIRAGGEIEKLFILPMFTVIVIVATLLILFSGLFTK